MRNFSEVELHRQKVLEGGGESTTATTAATSTKTSTSTSRDDDLSAFKSVGGLSTKSVDTSTESDDVLSSVESPSSASASVSSSKTSPEEKKFSENSSAKIFSKRKSPPFDDVTSSVVKHHSSDAKKPKFESSSSALDILSQIFPARSRSSLEQILRETGGDLNRALELCAKISGREHRKISAQLSGDKKILSKIYFWSNVTFDDLTTFSFVPKPNKCIVPFEHNTIF